MKNKQVALVLAGLMLIMTAGTVWLLLRYNSSTKELRDLGLKIQLANNTENLMQTLLNQALEYGKTHPDVNPIVHSFTNVSASVPAAAPATAPAKPAAK